MEIRKEKKRKKKQYTGGGTRSDRMDGMKAMYYFTTHSTHFLFTVIRYPTYVYGPYR